MRPPGLDERGDLRRLVGPGSPIAREGDADFPGVAAAGRRHHLHPRRHRSGTDVGARFETANIRSAISRIGEERRRRDRGRSAASPLGRASAACAAGRASSDRRQRPSGAACAGPEGPCARRVVLQLGAAARFRSRARGGPAIRLQPMTAAMSLFPSPLASARANAFSAPSIMSPGAPSDRASAAA